MGFGIMEFRELLKNFGIETRLGACHLNIAYDYLSKSNQARYEAEFVELANMSDSPMSRYINVLRAKNRAEEGGEAIFELLSEIYKKLDNLERLLKQEDSELPSLPYNAKLAFIGHDALCLESESFLQLDALYIRLFLPTLPQHHIGIFAKALNPQIAQIERIHIRERQAYDSFVVECERAMILDKKSLQ